MPIRASQRHRYPADWTAISLAVKESAGWQCECLGECGRGTHLGRCPNVHLQPAYGTGSRVILTTAHLDHTPENCARDNLRAMCQGCHLHYDRDHHAATRRHTQQLTKLGLPADPAIVGLFEGYGGLTMGIQQVIGGHLVAYAEYEPPHVNKRTGKVTPSRQPAARLLARHHPGIPNLGDVATIDWTPWRGRVDVIGGGFPCQDVSLAGLRGGMHEGTRSGLWAQFARAIDELHPKLVVIENVPGLRSAPAGLNEEVDDAADSDLEPDPWHLGESARAGGSVLRALGAVLGDLASLGFDAEWTSVQASDVGAPHLRERIFIVAHPRNP